MKLGPLKKSADDWLMDSEFYGIQVMDPDGWDRSPGGFDASWHEEITMDEMHKRISDSTCSIPVAMINKWVARYKK